MSAFELLVAMAKALIWMGAYAQLLGMPVAWLRIRNTTAWRNRPANLRRIDVLANFTIRPTVFTILWGWVMLAVAAAGGLGLSGATLIALILGAPAIFVPWAVLQLDLDRFPNAVEETRQRRERGEGGSPF
jgi:hypothetical protein